ncbi:MAG: hypothetical protein EXR55_04530 [Dehalococcoidia bacterium]|nr:hypothetical protein [Dehalococcoidia bacterium]
MEVSEALRLRHLEEENRKLKQLLAEATLDTYSRVLLGLQEAAAKQFDLIWTNGVPAQVEGV